MGYNILKVHAMLCAEYGHDDVIAPYHSLFLSGLLQPQ